ncbi:MAG TPA: twin-arginine translocase TatA/TatE family subunit [Acidimicrobiales bacterium]|jgi:sec-independent protein translocase protein TatA
MLAEIIGPDLLVVLLIAVVVLFGGAAIPKLARNLGSAKKEFEKGIREGHSDAGGAAPTGSPTLPHDATAVNPQPNPGSGPSR